MGLTPQLQLAACAVHLWLAGLYDHSDTLTTRTSVPGARALFLPRSLAGIYDPTSANPDFPYLRAGWALRPQQNALDFSASVPHPALTATAGTHLALYL